MHRLSVNWARQPKAPVPDRCAAQRCDERRHRKTARHSEPSRTTDGLRCQGRYGRAVASTKAARVASAAGAGPLECPARGSVVDVLPRDAAGQGHVDAMRDSQLPTR